MILNHLVLKNFRNHSETDLYFDSKLVFFVGDNGEGKTNIIEAIGMFSTLKSFRECSDNDILQWGQPYYYMKSEFSSSMGEKVMEIGYQKEEGIKKKLKLNGNQITKRTDLVGELKCVIFSPSDLKIVEGGPAERRRFLDRFLSLIDKKYFISLLEYNKVLKHRNALLKDKNCNPKEIVPWNNLLLEKGMFIKEKRELVLNQVKNIFKEYLFQLSGKKDDLDLVYKPNVVGPDDFHTKLNQKLDYDRKVGFTTVGIHRDVIYIGDKNRDITEFGSQGQKRSVAISLRTAEFKYMQSYLQDDPILLVDDVIRELDIKRRRHFIELVGDCGQAFFTTTDLDGISDYIGNLKVDKQVYLVKDGKVENG
ncbi:MAG: DNA replication/repair protein RecF [Leptospiraceae bacterium]|nr:DNA replication/repair protein RecF [Leptospiraceae bacterium]MCP5493331.1 DNA replication/repair protein RecF [Leptospiraceae bacterium]